MGEDKPELNFSTCLVAGFLALVLIAIAVVVHYFRLMFGYAELGENVRLSAVTGLVLYVPPFVWATIALVGAGVLVAKSRYVRRTVSKKIDLAVLAGAWLALPVWMVCVRRFFLWATSGMPGTMNVPLLTRVVLRIPEHMWILLGLLAALVLIWKARVLPAKTSDLVDVAAAAALLVLTVVVGIALLRPLLWCMYNL